jgi:hypothetical protein
MQVAAHTPKQPSTWPKCTTDRKGTKIFHGTLLIFCKIIRYQVSQLQVYGSSGTMDEPARALQAFGV